MKTSLLTLLAFALTAANGLAQDRPSRPAPDNAATAAATAVAATNAPANIKLNFQDTPIDSVLEYLAKEAGFTVIKEADISGNIKAFSAKPLTREQAYDVITTLLYGKGYATIRNGDIITVVSASDAKRRPIPIKQGANPNMIPPNDTMVTQIIPVRYANAQALVQNLQPLMDEDASISANESSNALLITDTQVNIRRMVQIVQALDTSISGITAMRVYPLRNASATEAASVLNQVFNGQTSSTAGRGSPSSSGRSSMADMISRMRSRMGR
ncbi:MAG: hypothetical protein CMO80_16830 [Verrucomicrobiales bacterium]|nr:hypothetical protein [Verrucomicrobiales bacterium]